MLAIARYFLDLWAVDPGSVSLPLRFTASTEKILGTKAGIFCMTKREISITY